MIGRTIGQYRVTDKLGAGGMGEVYLALDTKLDREVALKFLPRPFAGDPDARQRFQREAKALATLSHPNIVTVFDVSEDDGQPFIAMEYLKGKSLKAIIDAGDLDVEQALGYAAQIADGLAAAHKADVVHRDIKSENIIVSPDGRVRIMDFGLATWRGVTKVTQEGSTVGTMAYMSPEQTQGKAVDQRADLWSLGVVLYEMLTGRLPFEGEHQGAMVYAIVQDTPQPLARYCSDLPAGVAEIVSKALEKDPQLRYQTATDLLADLRRVRRTSDASMMSMASMPTAASTGKRGVVLMVSAAIVIVFAVAGFLWLKPWQSPPPTVVEEAPQRKMLAVIPFKNLGAPGDECFADGVTEEILTNLSRIPGLGVISRTSTLQYRDTDKTLKEIGNELGVEYVLEASIQWQKSETESRIRLHPQLIRVSDDVHVWAGRFDAVIDDLFKVQSDIATQVADALSLALLDRKPTDPAIAPTEDTEAYELYLQARGFAGGEGKLNVQRAIEHYERAVARDPGFALAWAGLAESYSDLAWNDLAVDPEAGAKAKAAIDQAMALAPDKPEVLVALGLYYNIVEQEYERALAVLTKAQEYGEDRSEVFAEIAFVQSRQGHFDDAVANYAEALRLEPTSKETLSDLVWVNSMMRRFAEAERYVNRLIALDPDDPAGYSQKVTLYMAWRGIAAARKVVAEAAQFVDPIEVVGGTRQNPQPFVWEADLLDRDPQDVITLYKDVYDSNIGPLYYFGLASLHSLAGNTQTSAAYWDTTRTRFESQLASLEGTTKPGDLDAVAMIHGGLATAYEKLGQCERALLEGRRAMEALPTSSCHL